MRNFAWLRSFLIVRKATRGVLRPRRELVWTGSRLLHIQSGRSAGVSCTSPRACTAVGSAGLGARPLVERSDGTRWTRQSDMASTTTGGELGGVACRTAAVCVAVGGTFVGGVLDGLSAGRTLAERWAGHAWTLQQAAVTTSAAGSLYSVSCTSASACTAVGEFETDGGAVVPVAERWNGSASMCCVRLCAALLLGRSFSLLSAV